VDAVATSSQSTLWRDPGLHPQGPLVGVRPL